MSERQAANLCALKLSELKPSSNVKQDGEDAKPAQNDADMAAPEEEDIARHVPRLFARRVQHMPLFALLLPITLRNCSVSA